MGSLAKLQEVVKFVPLVSKMASRLLIVLFAGGTRLAEEATEVPFKSATEFIRTFVVVILVPLSVEGVVFKSRADPVIRSFVLVKSVPLSAEKGREIGIVVLLGRIQELLLVIVEFVEFATSWVTLAISLQQVELLVAKPSAIRLS